MLQAVMFQFCNQSCTVSHICRSHFMY